jgi:naphthoate synthase
MDEASRRLAVLERQCCAGPGPSSSLAQQGAQQSSYASATGTPSSYARVHGQVSREPAHWREIQCVAKEQLSEVKYAKSEEGIAKVQKSTMTAAVAGGQ